MTSHSHHPIETFSRHLPGGGIVTCISAGSGELTLEKLEALIAAFDAGEANQSILLISDALVLPTLTATTQTQWIVKAGHYRRLQQVWKHRGGTLFSLVTETLNGGTYLLHGLAAETRFVFENTRIYPALPPERYESLTRRAYPHDTDAETAFRRGLITHILQPADLWDTMAEWVR